MALYCFKSVSTDDGFNQPIQRISKLFRGITSNNHGDFYCLNCLLSFQTDNTLKRHERIFENNNYCEVVMPTKSSKILKCNNGEKLLRTPFKIYADLECVLWKQRSCQNNPEKSYTERKVIHEPSGYAINLVGSFDSEQNEQSFYRGKDCIKRFCCKLKELGTKIVNDEMKDMIPLTDNENKYYKEQVKCYLFQKEFCYCKTRKRNLKYIKKLKIIIIIQENLKEQLIGFAI